MRGKICLVDIFVISFYFWVLKTRGDDGRETRSDW